MRVGYEDVEASWAEQGGKVIVADPSEITVNGDKGRETMVKMRDIRRRQG